MQSKTILAVEIKGQKEKKRGGGSPSFHFICSKRPLKKAVAAPKGLVVGEGQ